MRRFEEILSKRDEFMRAAMQRDTVVMRDALSNLEDTIDRYKLQGYTFEHILDELMFENANYRLHGDKFMEQVRYLFR